MRDLEALRSVLEGGSATSVDENLIGPGYIATAALIHWVSGLSPEDSLIALTRLSYPLAVAGSLGSCARSSGASSRSRPLVSLPAQLTFVALVFVAGTWHWSDIPWSQFYAAFLAVAFYVLRPSRPATRWSSRP